MSRSRLNITGSFQAGRTTAAASPPCIACSCRCTSATSLGECSRSSSTQSNPASRTTSAATWLDNPLHSPICDRPSRSARLSGLTGRSTTVLCGSGALRVHVDRVDRLARRHEQPVALRSAEAEIAADLGKTDAADQLALRRPDGDAVVPDRAAGVARAPDVAVDVAAHAVGRALDAVDHEVREDAAVRHLVVAAHVENEHDPLAAGSRVARPLAGADDVDLLVVWRERDPVRIGYLLFRDDERDGALAVGAIDGRRQFPLLRAPLVETAAVRRIGEPVA